MNKISILIPVFNTEETLKRCLDSVLNQTLEDIEIIITNDGSRDNSQNIIEEYAKKDNRIKFFIQENSGLGATRNNGIEMATGEYIAFLDSDDWVDRDYYEKMYNVAKKGDIDLVISSFCIENICINDRTYMKFNYKDNDKDNYLKDLINGNVDGFSWNKLYKRSMINENNLRFPLREEFENVEDQYFSIRSVYYSKKIAFINNTNIHYFINKDSIVRKYQKTLLNDIIKLHKSNIKLFQDNKFLETELYNKLYIGIINIINNEFKPNSNRSRKEKIDVIRSIDSFKEFKNIIIASNNYNLKRIDKLYIRLLKNKMYKMLYIVASLRCKYIYLRMGIYKF